VPMRGAHAVKRTLPEVTRPAPTRPFGWAARSRRLAKGYERLTETLEGMHYVAFSFLMLRRAVPHFCWGS
jgi:hypothetical protein